LQNHRAKAYIIYAIKQYRQAARSLLKMFQNFLCKHFSAKLCLWVSDVITCKMKHEAFARHFCKFVLHPTKVLQSVHVSLKLKLSHNLHASLLKAADVAVDKIA